MNHYATRAMLARLFPLGPAQVGVNHHPDQRIE
jgi:hypothetical protein